MWITSDRLRPAVEQCLSQFKRPIAKLVMTMTGELADCFQSRGEGVTYICNQVALAAPEGTVSVYSVDGNWLTIQDAKATPWDVAASNWHAVASWVGSSITKDENALLIDVGSTTVDIIPIQSGRVHTPARTDRERLQLGQLVYTGLTRTPVAMIVRSVDIEGTCCPVMAERFADSLDAYLVLDLLPERPEERDTTDGKPKTKQCAEVRLARMVGEDRERLGSKILRSLAEQVIEAQTEQIFASVTRNHSTDLQRIVFSGHGLPLIRRLIQRINQRLGDIPSTHLSEIWSAELARVGPAYALAKIWQSANSQSRNS